MARRLGEFSEKDRVRLRAVIDATRGDAESSFIWRGARWGVSGRGEVYARQNKPNAMPSMETRVRVSRRSSIAKMSADEGGHGFSSSGE